MSNFIQSKLSHKSLDAFVQKYATTEQDSHAIPYTTENGQNIFFYVADVYMELNNIEEFKYLLGQTIPYHSTNAEFPIQDLAFIKNEDGSKQLWTKNSKLLTQFVTIANRLTLLTLKKGSKGEPIAKRSDNVVPVIHKEK